MKTIHVLRSYWTEFSGAVLAALLLAAPSVRALPIITSVVETGGDNEATDTVPAKWTGVTYVGGVANEPVPGLAAGASYTVRTFGNHSPAMVDRNHRYTNASDVVPIPPYLLGGEYIMCGNDNRDNASYLLDVTLSVPAIVYLLIDNRLGGNNADPPTFDATHMQWVLDEGWQPVITGANRAGNPDYPDEVGFDEGADGTLNQWYSVYSMSFPAGTFQLKQADNAGQNMYGVVVTLPPDSIDNPPKIVSLVPTNNAMFYEASGGLHFEATTISPNTLAPGNIRLWLNGTDVSANLVIGGTPASRTGAYSQLVANTIYQARLVVSDQAGRSTTNDWSFDTFNATTAIVVEAEDYNHSSGQFQNPALPASYSGLAGAPDIDFHDIATALATQYRPDVVGLAVSTDGPRQYFIDAGAADYQVIQFLAGDWMNYTRNFDLQSYTVYLRASAAVAQVVQLDKVTDAELPTQTASALGMFSVAPGPFSYVPLTDALGNPVRLNLSGLNTLRLTALYSANPTLQLNFLLLVPTTAAARPPYVSEALPAVNAANVPLDATVKITLANGTTQVAPASVRLQFGGSNVTGAATVSPSAVGAEISYDPPADLITNTSYLVRVVFDDTTGASFTQAWTLKTVPYRPIIRNVVETGGDDSVNAPAQYTGQSFTHPNLGAIRLGVFGEDAPTYRNRLHQWNSPSGTVLLPDYLVGGEYIMMLQENRDNASLQVDVEISEPALVYVLVDNRLGDTAGGNPPDFSGGAMAWLIDNGWTPVMTGLNRNNVATLPDEVGVDEGGDGVGPGVALNQWASVYVKRIEEPMFSLFQADNSGQNMYGVVVRSVASHAFTPTVTMTAPADGDAFPAPPNTVSIAVDAAVENSTITKVECFYGVLNKVKIGEDTSAPYEITWNQALPGRYVLTAKATAANGRTAVTAPITIVVGEVLSVNFQATSAPVPTGYLPDFGNIFTDQGNGFSYGWDDDNTQHARDRNNARSPDERYDTFNHLQKTSPLPAGRFWEIEVPNQTYLVHVAVGESDNQDSVFDLTAEGTSIVTGIPDAVVRWFEATTAVTISDGRLTLGNGPTASNNKLCFVDIATLPADLPRPVVRVQARTETSLTLTWTLGWKLQQAPDIAGPWTDVPGKPQGSHTVPTTGSPTFYRAVLP
jgi:hypothetical protein